MKKSSYILPILLALCALSVSGSAAFYSVFGLSKLFAGASTQVIVMAASLEISKLVLAAFLHRYWKDLGKFVRTYLTTAVVVLVLITSMGIYGYLSSAFEETSTRAQIVDTRIAFLEQKEELFEENVARINLDLDRVSNSIENLSNARATEIQVRDTSVEGGIRNTVSTLELRLARERIQELDSSQQSLLQQRNTALDSLQTYRTQILEAQVDNDLAAELGPLKYLSKLTGLQMNQIVNILLLTIIFVFDPLAVSMIIASSMVFSKFNFFKRRSGQRQKQVRTEAEGSQKKSSKIQEPDSSKKKPTQEKRERKQRAKRDSSF